MNHADKENNTVETNTDEVLETSDKLSVAEFLGPDWKKYLELQQLKDLSIISIGIAATGEDPLKDKIMSITVGAPDHTPLLIDLTQYGLEEMKIFLKPLLESPSEKVFYDGKRAINFFHLFDIAVNGPIYDVMLADKLLQAGQWDKKRSFDDIVIEYLGTADRIESTTLLPITNAAALLLKLREATIPLLQEDNLMDTAALEFDCIRAVAGMERNGIRVNDKKLMEMLKDLVEQKGVFAKYLHNEMGNINLDSPKQVLKALNELGIMVNDTRQETILPFFMEHLWIWNYISYKNIDHNRSTAKGLLTRINANTGRLYPKYSQIGTPDGRFSCSDPSLHSIPRGGKFKSCFIADDGHKLVIADFSQIELRIAAEISQDKQMIRAYQWGDDLHRLTAALVTGESLAGDSKDKYALAKVVNSGLVYGMKAEELVEYSLNQHGVSITLPQAEKYRYDFFSTYTGISQWHQDVEFHTYGETRTLGNRRRVWGGYYTNTTEFIKAQLQGTSADITKKALHIFHERIQGSGIRIIGCIHDEIITEAPLAETETAAEILRDSMIDAGKMYLKDVPVVVDVFVTDNWYEK
jgi:DNA polymerase I-like protein with 3'-5' exonuclease and polymerase domains